MTKTDARKTIASCHVALRRHIEAGVGRLAVAAREVAVARYCSVAVVGVGDAYTKRADRMAAEFEAAFGIPAWMIPSYANAI